MRRQHFSSLCDQVGSPRAPSAQKAAGSHFALTVLFQASSIGFEASQDASDQNHVSVYAVSREDSALMTSGDGITIVGGIVDLQGKTQSWPQGSWGRKTGWEL